MDAYFFICFFGKKLPVSKKRYAILKKSIDTYGYKTAAKEGEGMTADENYPLALPQGTILAGQYVISRVLGQGGFGITYQASDHKTGRMVAVKEFFPDSMAARTDKTAVSAFSGERGESFAYGKACFLKEAETLAQFIGNEHIVRVFSYFEENGTAYFVMEFIEGTSFDQYIKDCGGKVPYEEAEKILLPVIDALAAVHAKGIVHRDVTPDNIYITKDGGVKLLDFGAARYSLGDKSRSLDVVLKHGFAPKEQYTRHGKQGPYTDVYTVGASFYFAVTGRRPPDSIDRLEEDELVPPSSLVKIPQGKEDAILKAMSVQPSGRYQTMGEFRQALMGAPAAGAQNAGGMPQDRIQPMPGGVQQGISQPVPQRVFTAPQQEPATQKGPGQPVQGLRPQQPYPVSQPMPAVQPSSARQIYNQPSSQPAMQNTPQSVMPNMARTASQPATQQGMPQTASQLMMQQGGMPRTAPQPAKSGVPQPASQSAVFAVPNARIQPMQQKPEASPKKKWLLPAGIGAAVIAAAVIIVLVIPHGDSKKESAHYVPEMDPDIALAQSGGENPASVPNTAEEPGSGTDNGDSGNGIVNPGAFSSEAANLAAEIEMKGNLPGNVVNGAYFITNSDGIACWYPGAGLVWSGDDGASVYDSTTGVIQSISVVDDVIYYVDADQRACRVGTDGKGIAYMGEADGYEIFKLWVEADGFWFVTTDYRLCYCERGKSPSCSVALYDGPVFYDNDIYYVPTHDPQGLYRIGKKACIEASGTEELICRINAGEITMQSETGTSEVKGNGNLCPYVAADGYLYAVYSEAREGATAWEAILQIDLSNGVLSDTMINPAIEGGHITSVNEQGGYLYFANYNELTQESSVERCLTSCFQAGAGTIDTVWEGESHYIASVSVIPNESKIAFYRVDSENHRQVVITNTDGSGEPVIFSDGD